MVASFPGVMFGPLHYRKIEKEKSQALKQCKGDYEAKMTLPTYAKSELQWWINHIHTAYNVINRNSSEITVFTDASKTGWGGVTEGGDRAGDNWTPSEVKSHINFLELLAVFHSLKAFNDKL